VAGTTTRSQQWPDAPNKKLFDWAGSRRISQWLISISCLQRNHHQQTEHQAASHSCLLSVHHLQSACLSACLNG